MNIHKFCLAILLIFFCTALTAQKDPQRIIDAAIDAHGGERFSASKIGFDFRDRYYSIERNGGNFTFKRIFTDSTGAVEDALSNTGFTRRTNGEPVELSDEWQQKYSNSVNSVAYFALLPYRLNDAAVIKRYIGTSEIKGEPYYEVEITFQKEGGGKDYEDVFVYWIHQKNYTMDYLAYSYIVDGGGTRFREALNVRTVNGIRFADYHNYKGAALGTDLSTFDDLFQAGEFKKLSTIALENISVDLLTE